MSGPLGNCKPNTRLSPPSSYLGNAQPHVRVPLGVIEAKLEVVRFVGVEVEVLVVKRLAAGRDRAVVVPVVENVKGPGVFVPLVEGDTHADKVLGYLEGISDAAPVVRIRAAEDVPLARPTRVCPDIVVAGVVGYAAFRAAATPGCTSVVTIGIYANPGPVTRLDQRCNGGGCVPWESLQRCIRIL